MHAGGRAKINGTFSSRVVSLLSFQLQYGLITHSSPMYLLSWASGKRNFSCMWGRYESCHSHLPPCPCSVNITPLQEDDKGTWRAEELPSLCCCGPEAHTLILHPVSSSKNKSLSSPAGTESISLSSFLSLHSAVFSISFLWLRKWENCPWLLWKDWILFYTWLIWPCDRH